MAIQVGAGATGYRLALVAPALADQLSPYALPVPISRQLVPCLTEEEAANRLGLLGLLFLFFIDAAQGRASVLYHRYDGHYGLITPAGWASCTSTHPVTIVQRPGVFAPLRPEAD